MTIWKSSITFVNYWLFITWYVGSLSDVSHVYVWHFKNLTQIGFHKCNWSHAAVTVYNFYHLLVWLLPDTDKWTTFMYNIYPHGVRRRRGGEGALSVHAFQWQLQVKIKTTLLSPTPLSISPFYTIDIKYILVVVSLIFLSIKFCWFIKNQFWRYTVLLPFSYFNVHLNLWVS